MFILHLVLEFNEWMTGKSHKFLLPYLSYYQFYCWYINTKDN